MKTAIFLVLSWAIFSASGFIPVPYLVTPLRLLSLDFSSAITHKDMSRAAILSVAAQFLIDNPNPENEGSSSRIAALPNLSEEGLITAYYGEEDQNRVNSFIDVIEAINDANADVDLGQEQTIAAAHFDSEQVQAGQNRLVELRQNIVAQILMKNFDLARTDTGRMFHTLQDFYSHSNWIENGNRSPYRVLGQENERPENIASPKTRTCTDCESAGTFSLAEYICQDNIRLFENE